jgi:hypothetical protein
MFSDNAGAFICNETYYRTLEQLATTDDTTPCLFCHLPPPEIVNAQEGVALVTALLACMLQQPPKTRAQPESDFGNCTSTDPDFEEDDDY